MFGSEFFLLDMTRVKNRKQMSKLENNLMFMTTFMRLCEDAMRRYRITGLPDTVNDRVILQSLLFYGNVTFFEENGSVLALPSIPSGKGFNVNGDPVSAWVFSKNGLFNKEIDLYVKGGATDPLLDLGVNYTSKNRNPVGVMVWENRNRYPFMNTILYYAQAIADTMRTIDTARIWLKQPFIAVCEESQVQSIKKVLNEVRENQDVIVVSSGMQTVDTLKLEPIDNSGDGIKSAVELVDWYEQKFRELCGTDANTQIDKKGENLVADEIHVNDEYTNSIEDNVVTFLQSQFDQVNEVFGLNIRVEQIVTKEQGIENEKEDIVNAEQDS